MGLLPNMGLWITSHLFKVSVNYTFEVDLRLDIKGTVIPNQGIYSNLHVISQLGPYRGQSVCNSVANLILRHEGEV